MKTAPADNNQLPAAWQNQVVHGDVLETLRELPDNCLHMVYADPDYNVGVNYAGKQYTKRWQVYIEWYGTLITEALRVLRTDGNLFTINYPRQNAHLWVHYLERLAYDVHEYAWVYNTNVGHTPRRFTTAHRSILHATKSKHNAFYKEQVALPYQNPNDARILGRLADGSSGRMPYSWFYFNLVKNVSRDKTFHACQIPLGLVEMLIAAATRPHDSVFILFGGSGAEVKLARELQRVYLACETHPDYYELIQQQVAAS